MRDLNQLFDEIDAANACDPTTLDGQPLAQQQGRTASRWLAELTAEPSDELQLAVRAHHLRRWEIARADFPEGRQGYLAWRRHNKGHQAVSLAELMGKQGWPTHSIERTGTLLARTKLRSDPETQMLEDAACLVFLETQFDPMIERMTHDRLIGVVAKTLNKMSAHAVILAGSIDLSAQAQAVLTSAVALVDAPEKP